MADLRHQFLQTADELAFMTGQLDLTTDELEVKASTEADARIALEVPALMESTAEFNSSATRKTLIAQGFNTGRIVCRNGVYLMRFFGQFESYFSISARGIG